MTNQLVKISFILVALAPWLVVLRPSLTLGLVQAHAPTPQTTQTTKNNEELARIFKEDQSDRMPKDGKAIDWKIVGPRDKARLARVKELYEQNGLQTGADYFYAAMILQHGEVPEDYLLAHELCVVAISKGEARAKWLAAASEDRFLMNIGRPQRFGTQYRSDGPKAPVLLYTMGAGVTDELRRAMEVPPLAEAKAREAEFNKK